MPILRTNVQIEDYTVNQKEHDKSFKELSDKFKEGDIWYVMFRNRKSPLEVYRGETA
jgi:hypothetical protein